MDHLQFKANQTAAVYVADGLDPPTQEAFEMHLMACAECVEDVETWRAVKTNMPARVRPLGTGTVALRRFKSATTWRMAATLLVGGAIGASGGWFGRALQGSDADSDRTLFFSMPSVERGSEECRNLRLSPQATQAVLRVPGISRDERLVPVDPDRHALPENSYSVRLQPDGSQLLRLKTGDLIGRAVHLETRGSDGAGEPIGCVTGTVGE